MSSNIEPESEKVVPQADVNVQTLDAQSDLGHVPASRRSKLQAIAKSLTTKEGWLGDYDYGALLMPNIPFVAKQKRELPFYSVNERLPHVLLLILGLQQWVKSLSRWW